MSALDDNPLTRSPADATLADAPHRIAKVTLAVNDLDAVAEFYRDVVGLRPTWREARAIGLGSADATLAELRHEPEAPRRSPKEAGLFHTAFLLPERADLAAWVAFAAEKGIRLSGAADHIVSEAVYLSDPEGNGIEIYADRPRTSLEINGRSIRMTTDPLDFEGLLSVAEGRRWSGFPDAGIVGHVHLQVGEIEAAEAFYRDLLGFDLTARLPGGSFFGSGGYHHQMAANIWNSRGAPMRRNGSTGLAGVEVTVNDAVFEAIRSKTAPEGSAPESPASAGAHRLALRDPWGTAITVLAS